MCCRMLAGVHAGLRAWWHNQQGTEQQPTQQQQPPPPPPPQQQQQPPPPPPQQQQQPPPPPPQQQQPAAPSSSALALGQQLLPGVELHQPVLAGAAGTAVSVHALRAWRLLASCGLVAR